jgi:peptidoglycan/LPS O-acetylase OafA/YrhL
MHFRASARFVFGDVLGSNRRGSTVRHGNNLDLIRFVAASAVVFGHSWPILGFRDPELFGKGVDGLGVMMFFAVSGFLITQSWAKHPDLSHFWIKRGLRILPALTIMLLLVTFVIGPIVSTLSVDAYLSSPQTWTYALRNMLLWTTHPLPGVFQSNTLTSVNNSLWTLPMEVTMYAATLAMVPLLARHPRAMTAVLTFAAFVAMALYIRHPWALRPITDVTIYSYRFIDLCVYAPSYLIGVLFASLRADEMRPSQKTAVLALSAAALLWAELVPNTYNLLLILVPVTTVTLIFGLSTRFAAPFFSRIGDLSYGTFLWGFVIQQMIVWSLGGAITPLELAAVSLPVSWCLGALSWHLIEKPALRWKPGRATIVSGPPPRLTGGGAILTAASPLTPR